MSSYETLLTVWKKTIHYSNIFDYPLTPEEIHRYAVTKSPTKQSSFNTWVKNNADILEKHFSNTNNLWTVKGRNKLASLRPSREEHSKRKIHSARTLFKLFYLIPWIKFIGITGTVAAHNADKDDDTDLFVITAKRRIWLSRAIILTLFTVFGKRSDASKPNTNGYCLNHIITEDNLEVDDKNIYIANDISRMVVVLNRGKSYEKFLQANEWIKSYLANWWETTVKAKLPNKEEANRTRLSMLLFVLSAPLRAPFVLLSWVFDVLENITKKIQLRNLKQKNPRIKKEGVDPLQYHPHDHRDWVLREYYLAIRE